MQEKQRPLMLKDFLRDASPSRDSNRKWHRNQSSNESPTTMRNLLDMDSKSSKRTGLVLSRPASTTLSALHKASEVIVRLLPFSSRTPPQKRQGNAVIRRQNVNKLSSILRRVASMREPRTPRGGLSRRISAAMRSLSRREPCIKRDVEVQVRVRDIVRWRSFGDEEEIPYLQYHNSKTPPREELSTADGTSDSCSSSRTSSCTWSESESLSNSQSGCGSSECSVVSGALNNKMLLLSYHREVKDGVDDEFQKSSFVQPPTDTPIHSLGFNRAVEMKEASDSLNGADTCCPSGQKEDVQQLGRANDGCTMCRAIEGYEEKEQFSPVSVLDFPFEDEDEGATTSFEESLADIERKRQQLLHKIGRYESLSKLDPVDLEREFALTEFELLDEDVESFTGYHDGNAGDEVENAEEYIREIILDYLDETTKRNWLPFESLVIDVFREELSSAGEVGADELVGIAVGRVKEWVIQTGSVDQSREFCLKELERSQDWRKFVMDEEEVAAEMEVDILWSLVDDLLIDLMV
ncbi:hypothetical protein EJ110_NYTH04236 [Nymphaea thermarum]|nr:hypothetical protein EJ110_NYTH04236 [Nymphaea thermarum]